jgi:superfamily II DNA helicase RecQ
MRFFNIPLADDGKAADELNRFLAAHSIAALEKHLVQDGANSAWAVCVTYLTGEGRPEAFRRGRVDYRDALNEKDFAVFVKLRALRKELAEKNGVPAYALFKDEQLAEMIRRQARTATALKEIPGVGDSRVEKYGEAFLAILTAAGPSPDAPQSTPGSKNQGQLPLA